MSKKALREEVSRRIETHRDDLVRITQELVRIQSVNPPGAYEEMSGKMMALYGQPTSRYLFRFRAIIVATTSLL